MRPRDRVICYVRTKPLGLVVSEELGCHLYPADLEGRDRTLDAWRRGMRSTLIVATSALGARLDYPYVRCIVHAGAPTGMLDYAQETGRSGRDGLHADCLTVLLPTWQVS